MYLVGESKFMVRSRHIPLPVLDINSMQIRTARKVQYGFDMFILLTLQSQRQMKKVGSGVTMCLYLLILLVYLFDCLFIYLFVYYTHNFSYTSILLTGICMYNAYVCMCAHVCVHVPIYSHRFYNRVQERAGEPTARHCGEIRALTHMNQVN